MKWPYWSSIGQSLILPLIHQSLNKGGTIEEQVTIGKFSFEKVILKPGKYYLESSTYKHVPKNLEISLAVGDIKFIKISHGTGWVDVWYDLLESNIDEFLKWMKQ